MLEKIKDILYDLSDVVLSLVIVALIFFVVSWKISDSLAFDVTVPDKTAPTESAVQDPDIVEITDVTDTEEVPTENTGTETATETPATETPASETAEASTSTDAKPGGTQVDLVGVTKTVEIKSGSSAYDMGDTLEAAGIISDGKAFVTRSVELKLDTKLRSGTFKLSSDMSLDEIIYKISGQ